MLKSLYLSLYFVPLLVFVAVEAHELVQQYQGNLECVHQMSRHPLTTTCTQ